MKRPVIHVLDAIHDSAIARLEAAARVKRSDPDGDWAVDADAVIVRTSRIDASALAKARRLRVIGKHGVGTDNIDMAAAARAGVAVVSTPGANAPSVADQALALALCLARNVVGHDRAMRAGQALAGADRIGYELAELPCGVVGVGAVGRATAHRLVHGFGAEVSGYDPQTPASDWPRDVRRLPTLDALLSECRMVFLHLPLSPSTRGLVGARELALMPGDAFLVNCARGGIVDEDALAAALRAGRLRGAASDVFAVEPPPADHPLLGLSNFIAMPHVGAATHRGLERVGLAVAQRVLAALASVTTEGIR